MTTPHDRVVDLIKQAYLRTGQTEFWPDQFGGLTYKEAVLALEEARKGGLLRSHASVTLEGAVVWEGPVDQLPQNPEWGNGTVLLTYHLTDNCKRLLPLPPTVAFYAAMRSAYTRFQQDNDADRLVRVLHEELDKHEPRKPQQTEGRTIRPPEPVNPMETR